MKRFFLVLALMGFNITVKAHSTDAMPLDSIKPLMMKMANMSQKAINKEEIKDEAIPASKKLKKSINTFEELTGKEHIQSVEQPDTPIKVNERARGTFYVPNTEDKPTYPGGEKALREFIRNNRRYPQECKAERLSGKVTVAITIAPDGVPVKMEITSGSGNEYMDAEAMRVAELMPDWTPARDLENGKERIYNMTFTFRPGR